jgi:hypothetical protein
VCTTSVCLGSLKSYSSVQLFTHKYSPSVQEVHSCTVYLYRNLYTGCPAKLFPLCFLLIFQLSEVLQSKYRTFVICPIHVVNKNETFLALILPADEGQPVQIEAAVGGQVLSCHEADPRASQAQMNCVAARWCPSTPGQDVDEMARHDLPGQDACHQVLGCVQRSTVHHYKLCIVVQYICK